MFSKVVAFVAPANSRPEMTREVRLPVFGGAWSQGLGSGWGVT